MLKANKGQDEISIDLSKVPKAAYIAELRINGILVGRDKIILIN